MRAAYRQQIIIDADRYPRGFEEIGLVAAGDIRGVEKIGLARYVEKSENGEAELGDYTGGLASRLKVGDAVKVEGPWGRFDFSGDAPRQVWIGGGVGVTPFIARMQHLGHSPDGRPVDFFFSRPALHDR